MRVLGIETSCDETAAAVVSGAGQAAERPRLEANVVSSQIAVHRPFGGVVPEVASREHVVRIVDVVRQTAVQRGASPEQPFAGIDAIAVTRGPGLLGALLVGLQAAKGLALGLGLPWVGVHHLEAHLAAASLAEGLPPGPHLAAVVSGGHSHLFAHRGPTEVELVAATRDDAAGEAFDKVAKLLGLGYPGGPAVERAAAGGRANAFALPRALANDDDFSFSGLKTAAQILLRSLPSPLPAPLLADVCASLQMAIADSLADKAVRAATKHNLPGIVLAGGVAANGTVRARVAAEAARAGKWLFCPSPALCTDNAAMVAAAGRVRLLRGETSVWRTSARSRWPLAEAFAEAA